MRKLLPLIAAAGLVLAPAGAAYANCYGAHASAGKNMTVASTTDAGDEEAMTTYDPEKLKLDDEDKAE